MVLTPESIASLECPTNMSKPWTLAARAVIHDDAGRWLLLRRSSKCEHFVGTWELPGGKMDPSETIDAALCREVREETGLLVRPSEVLGVTECEMPETRLVTVYFHTFTETGTVTLSDEHDDFNWVPFAEIQKLNLNWQIRDFLRRDYVSGTELEGSYGKRG